MITKRSNVMMILEEDVKQLVYEWAIVPEWIKAHVSARCPAHRYEGELMIDEELVFSGRDIKAGKDFKLEIPFDDITDVSLGFSENLKSSTDPAFGIGGPMPFVVRYQDNGKSQTVYFNTSFNNYLAHGDRTNRKWYETLDEIVTKYRRLKLIGQRNHPLVAA